MIKSIILQILDYIAILLLMTDCKKLIRSLKKPA